MKLIKPSYQIIEQVPGIEGIYEQIEMAGRTCYKSTRPKGQTAKDFVDKMITLGHTSMLEHGTVYLKVTYKDVDYATLVDKYKYNKYSKCYTDLFDKYAFITTNLRVLQEMGCLNDLQYLCEPTEHHEKRITVKFTTSNSIMREFTRHRTMSYAVESTRYCNYSKDKFNNEITFIEPYWYKNPAKCIRSRMFEINLHDAENAYLTIITMGGTAQEAREVLPLATKCDMIMTGFLNDWEHFFKLRTSIIASTGKPHPDAAFLADTLYKEFNERNYMTPL